MTARTKTWPAMLLSLLAVAAFASFARAQERDRTVPRRIYFLAKVPFHQGEYRTAAKAFREAARSGVRSTEGRWIDSICYHTMIGECYYRMGDLPNALEQYNSACKLFLAHKDWLLRVQFPETLAASGSLSKQTITWGQTSRPARMVALPDRMLSFQGRLDNEQAIRQGGVVMAPMFFPVRVQEVVKCTAIAISRRGELMGPACSDDSLTKALVEALGRRPAPVNHWSQAWISLQLGTAYAAADKNVQAIAELRNSLQLAGTYDHELTALALLELGKLAFQQSQYDVAANFLLEATFSAVPYDQASIMEEAFRYGLMTHQVANKKGSYPPLINAARWAQIRDMDHLQASCLLLASEDAASQADNAAARRYLEQARRAIGRQEMQGFDIGARFSYITAIVDFQRGQVKSGDTALAQAMKYQQRASLRLFQINLADQLYLSGTLTDRAANELYTAVLREPTSADWSVDPMDTLAALLNPQIAVMERWFEAALKNKRQELAMEIADRIRRKRFYGALPMAGRLLVLRWVLEAPAKALSAEAALQRQDLLVKYPKYAQLAKESAAIRKEIETLPAFGGTKQEQATRKKRFAELAEVSTVQEVMLREMALQRNPSEFVFPPLHTTKEVKESMQQGQLAMAFFITNRRAYMFLFTKDNYAYRALESPAKIQSTIGQMLKDLGHVQKDAAISGQQLADVRWKKPAEALMELLFNKARPDFWDSYDELIIVPDGEFWYLPFEALQVPRGGGGGAADLVPLISRIRIRYLPTTSMIIPDARGRAPARRSVVVVGKLHPQSDLEVAQGEYERLRRTLPDAVALASEPQVPSGLLASTWDQLVVLDDIEDVPRSPFDWNPVQADRGKAGSTLEHWLQLPFGGPDQVILPGFHTPAEESLKSNAAGADIFLTLCGLMATGTRTVLISRWRGGGQTDFDLIREFLQELPHTEAANAWQRAVELAMERPLDLENQPRVNLGSVRKIPTAEHPFFWSGYILSDTGTVKKPKPEEARPALPAG